MLNDFGIRTARLLGRQNHLFHHLSDDTVGKDDSRVAVFESEFEAQAHEVCHFLDGGRGKGYEAIVAMTAAFYCLEIVGLTWLNGSESGTATHYVYNEAW